MTDLIEKLKSTSSALLALAAAHNSPPEIQAAAREAHEANMAVIDQLTADIAALDELLSETAATVALIENAMPKRVDGSPAHRPDPAVSA